MTLAHVGAERNIRNAAEDKENTVKDLSCVL